MERTFDRRYRRAERYILSREFFGMKLGLDAMAEFCGYLGSPQTTFPSVHIAGTNGKGSTTAMLGSILQCAGYKAGVYTSPHLVDFRERIRINGRPIDRRFIVAFVEKHRRAMSQRKITFFELMTALAFAYFADRKVDIAIIEVGLGGRLDATNVLVPQVCAITEISYDHESVLGATLPKIASEKAGIMKPGIPVILATQKTIARATLRRIARQINAPIREGTPTEIVRKFVQFLALPGKHQRDNLQAVLGVTQELQSQGWAIPRRAIKRGIAGVRWRGRFERGRLGSGPEVILDVAHNQSGLAALRRTFREVFPGRRAIIVMGFVRDKRIDRELQQFVALSSEIHITKIATLRTADPQEIASSLVGLSTKPVSAHQSAMAAFRAAFHSATEDDLILIMGSHYLIGEFLSNHPSFRTTPAVRISPR